jgi:hypothetical protein
MVNLDELLEIQGRVGKVCFKKEIDGIEYICVGFVIDEVKRKFEFKFYEVKYEDGRIFTKEVEDGEKLQKIASEYIVNTVEKTGLTDEFLNVFDN